MAVTSANVAGAAPPTDFLGAEEQLGDSVAIYLDAGPCPTRRPARSSTSPARCPGCCVRGAFDLDTLRTVCPEIVPG